MGGEERTIGMAEEILRRVFALLEQVEAHEGAGVLSHSLKEQSRGAFFVDGARVCLALDGSGSRLGELLTESSPQTARIVSEELRRAKAAGRKANEAIRSLDGQAIEQLRGALRRQTALATIELAQLHVRDELRAWKSNESAQWKSDWAPLGAGSRELGFSFSPVSIYFDAASILDTNPIDRASKLWGELSTESAFGGLFLDAGEDMSSVMLPLAVTGPRLKDLRTARKLSHAVHRLYHQWSLSSAMHTPQTMMFGTRLNDWIFAAGDSRVVLFRGADQATRARLAGRVLQSVGER